MNENDLPATRQHKNLLFDFYCALLTEKQREIYAMHHDDDCSLAEIGKDIGVTPQAVADMLKRTDKKLSRYEEKLSMVQKFQSQQGLAAEIEAELSELDKIAGIAGRIEIIREAVGKLLL